MTAMSWLLRRLITALLPALAGVGAMLPPPVAAESLRCNGQSAQEGDSRLSVLYKCGEPLLKDAYCAPVYHAPSLQQVPPPLVGIAVPCETVEEWLYDRGPGHLTATVRFRSGVVHSIHYGRQPR
jgi:hypothetical protein